MCDPRVRLEGTPMKLNNKIMLITYADSLGKDLTDLREVPDAGALSEHGVLGDISGRGDAGGHGDSCAGGSNRPDDRTIPVNLVAAGSRAAPVAGGGGHCTTGPILGD